MLPSPDNKSGTIIFILAGLIAASFLIFQSSVKSDSSKKPDVFAKSPFTVADSVKAIDPNYRLNFNRLTGYDLSGLHWNQFVVVYTLSGRKVYRNNFYEYLKSMQAFEDDEEYEPVYLEYPVGTVMVKENFSIENGKPGQPMTLTSMIKREPGYSPNYGDWEYIETDLKGNILIRGKAEDPIVNKRCAACHLNMRERDYIFSTFFSEVGAVN